MIPRYTLPEMGAIWDEQNKLRNWLKVEVAACEAWAELGKVPKEAVEKIKEKVKPYLEGEKDFDIKRINEIEERTSVRVVVISDASRSDNRFEVTRIRSDDNKTRGETSYKIQDKIGTSSKFDSALKNKSLEELEQLFFILEMN